MTARTHIRLHPAIILGECPGGSAHPDLDARRRDDLAHWRVAGVTQIYSLLATPEGLATAADEGFSVQWLPHGGAPALWDRVWDQVSAGALCLVHGDVLSDASTIGALAAWCARMGVPPQRYPLPR